MTAHVKDGGSWREIQEIHVKDGGAWREVQEGWVKDGGTWRKFYQAFTAQLDDLTNVTNPVFTSSGNPVSACQGIRIRNNGDAERGESDSTTTPDTYSQFGDDWDGDVGGTPGDDYHVRVTHNSGDALNGGSDSTGTWLALTSDREWWLSLSNVEGGSKTANVTVELSPDGGSTVEASATIDIEVQISTI